MIKMYCAKNVLFQYETKDPRELHCGGPLGAGVEYSCKRNCTCYCENKDDLEAAIGRLVGSRIETGGYN